MHIREDFRLTHGLAADVLRGWPADSIQAQIYRAATLARPDDDTVDRLLDAHCRAHGEPEAVAQLGRRDPRDVRTPSGPPLPHPYFLMHRAWHLPGVSHASQTRLGQVLRWAAEGLSTGAMAQRLQVSPRTVRRDLKRLGIPSVGNRRTQGPAMQGPGRSALEWGFWPPAPGAPGAMA